MTSGLDSSNRKQSRRGHTTRSAIEHWRNRLALAQGLFYFATGVWPLVSIETFMAVTGPKTDIWLVKTVGLLISATGIVLLDCARRRSVPAQVVLLAALNAGFLAGVDIFYVALDTIPPIYLLDAPVEIAFMLAWGFLSRSR